MTGEHQQRGAVTAARPEIAHLAERQAFAAKADRFQACAHECLAAGIVGRYRGAADQLFGEFQGRGHAL